MFSNPSCASNNFGDAIFQVTLCFFVSFWRGPRYEKRGTKGKNKTISTWGYEEELIAIKMATTTTMASFFHRGQAIKCSDNFSGKSETEQMQN